MARMRITEEDLRSMLPSGYNYGVKDLSGGSKLLDNILDNNDMPAC